MSLAEVVLVSPVCTCDDCDAIEAIVAEDGELLACGFKASVGFWCYCTRGGWQTADPALLCTHAHALWLVLAEAVTP
jgi:hypothetical protein